MTNWTRKHSRRSAELSALPVKLASTWQGVEVKPQRWLVKHRVPMRKVTLLNGDGAAGMPSTGRRSSQGMRSEIGVKGRDA
jgi:hypothetical protein